MALLIGKESCKIDSNGRFKFPVALKKQLQSTEDNRFAIRQGIFSECLELWTYQSFSEETKFLEETLDMYDPEDMNLLRRLSVANIIELDTNDRLLIPSEQKNVLGQAKEILLVGTGRFIEIWDAEKYNKLYQNSDDFTTKVKNRLGNIKRGNIVKEETN